MMRHVVFFTNVFFILHIWISPEAIHTSDDRCPNTFCLCDNITHIAKCSGAGRRMKFIPEFPSYISKVELDSNHFPWISRKVLTNLTKINLTDLSIKSAQIQQITSDAFIDLHCLANIRLGSNVHMNVSSLKASLSSLQAPEFGSLSFENMRWTSEIMSLKLFTHLSARSINKVYLGSNEIESLSDGSLDGLQGVKQLSLSNNRFKYCDGAFRDLLSLTRLDLNSNNISYCNISHFSGTIETLRMYNNRLINFPNFCSEDSTSLLPVLKYLRLDNNQIQSIDRLPIDCFPSLEYLSLTKNELQTIKSYTFSDLMNLRNLFLDEMKGPPGHIEDHGFSIPSLKTFDFSKNRFRFTVPVYAKRASLGNCTNLEVLDLSHNYMPLWPQDARSFFQGLTKLRVLRLIKVYWHSIPDGFFKLVPNVNQVTLSLNRITNLNSSLFSEYSRITEMWLDSNNIAYIGPGTFTKSFWTSIREIDLSGNPYLCDCNLLWFRDKLWKSRITFKQYPNLYQCLSPPGRKGLRLQHFNLTANDRECQQKSDLLTILISTCSAVVFVVLSMGFVYAGRWHIRYWIYLLRYRRTEYNRMNDRSLKYDAFIAYAEEDSHFVHDILLQKLENDHGYSLCIHARDFQIGKIIVDNIVECMSECRQVLVILSNNFCNSKWCKFELAIAQDRWLNNESEALVLVLLEEVDCRKMTKEIRALIKTTTYALWTENDRGQELFWEQLVSALNI